MLRTLIVGALAAFVGSRLIKANEEGRLDPLKARLKDGAERVRDRMDAARDEASDEGSMVPARALAAPPAASPRARKSADPLEVSKPAKAHPWPADPAAMPEES